MERAVRRDQTLSLLNTHDSHELWSVFTSDHWVLMVHMSCHHCLQVTTEYSWFSWAVISAYKWLSTHDSHELTSVFTSDHWVLMILMSCHQCLQATTEYSYLTWTVITVYKWLSTHDSHELSSVLTSDRVIMIHMSCHQCLQVTTEYSWLSWAVISAYKWPLSIHDSHCDIKWSTLTPMQITWPWPPIGQMHSWPDYLKTKGHMNIKWRDLHESLFTLCWSICQWILIVLAVNRADVRRFITWMEWAGWITWFSWTVSTICGNYHVSWLRGICTSNLKCS